MAISYVETEKQLLVLEKLKELIPQFAGREHQLSELGSFPFENMKDLQDIGYTKLTLPKDVGGNLFLYMILFYFKKRLPKEMVRQLYQLVGILELLRNLLKIGRGNLTCFPAL